ncbi:hypothetical protein B0H34DRAFT_648623 [Crassisporium funariophilum]|nr:hypothetical protein B0H34DRAFT_648623 [Crassisporium funariophilum]
MTRYASYEWGASGKYSRSGSSYSTTYDDTSPTGYDHLIRFPQPFSSRSNSLQNSPSAGSSSFLKSPRSDFADAVYPRKKPKEHPFAAGFERPQWRLFAIHVALCALSYPFLLIFVIVAKGKSLFWTRLFVGAGCGLLGVMLGLSLLRLARGMIEAATWATVIHQSRVEEGPGVRMRDLAAQSDDHSSATTALRLLWDRQTYPGADRQFRKSYDSRPWALYIFFFLANVALAGLMPFMFGRFVDITVTVMHQHKNYHEVVVMGDLSESDLKRADDLQSAFDNYILTWTLAPFSSHGSLPAVRSFQWNDDQVFFSEVALSQLVPGGSGFGTFKTDTIEPTLDLNASQAIKASVGVEPGSVLRFPRWGIRIKCAKIPDGPTNIITVSENDLTYLFTPRDTVRPLFQGVGLPFPARLEQPLNLTKTMHPNDTVPATLDISKIAMGAMFSHNGVAHSMKSTPMSMGADGNGFVTMENILVRLNTTYAPNGKFSTRGNVSVPDKDGFATFVGYDAAVCLQLYEPWVLEVYNSSVGFPSTMRIVDKAAEIKDMNTEELTERLKGKRVDDPNVARKLNSTRLRSVYIAGHQNSVNQILKDNGRDAFYVPSPTLISFTGGEGPFGYTELSEVLYAKSRALADASNVLPYFAGSGSSVARRYNDQVVASALIDNASMAVTIVIVFLMGLISALFVPKLPMDIPRRGFDLYSWMTAFDAHELVAERRSGINKNMELRDIMDHVGDLKFRYVG